MDTNQLVAEPLLAARYGTGAGLPPIPMTAAIEGMLRHRSVRAFTDQALPPGTVEALVAAAQSAPTSSNLQTWSVVAVEDAGRRDRLSRLASNQGFIRQAPLFLVWVADLSRNARLGEARGHGTDGLAYLEMFMVALIDAALAAQNALVAAESLGLGTVYVGALRNHPDAVAAELGLSPNAMGAFGLAIGHPDPAVATSVKPRLPQAAILHREYYGTVDEPEVVAEYDRRLTAFSEANGLGATGWVKRVLSRVGTAAGLGGRDRMRTVLGAMGFGLR